MPEEQPTTSSAAQTRPTTSPANYSRSMGGGRAGGSDGQRRGRQGGGRTDGQRSRSTSEYDDRVVSVDRVSRVVKGGRRIRFRALVVMGNRAGKVGMGVAKSGDVAGAVQKAKTQAERHMQTVTIINDTIPHESTVRYSGVRLLLKPASPGTSIVAGGAVRAVIELAGIKNVLSKSLGSSNKINMTKATLLALSSFKTDRPRRVQADSHKTAEMVEEVALVEATPVKKTVKPRTKKAEVLATEETNATA